LLAAFLPRFEVGPQGTQWRRRLIRLAESDVKGRDFGMPLMQHIQKMREMNTREWPLAKNLLLVLIDVHNHDARIDRRACGRTVTKSGIQRGLFQTLQKIEDRSGAFAKEGEEVKREA